MQIGAATVESSMEIHQKFLNGSAFWPSNPTSGNISEGIQNHNSKEHKHSYVDCCVIYSHQDTETSQVSINKWMDKTTVGHLPKEFYVDIKNENFALCNSMDRPGGNYANWNKPVKER